MTGARAELSGIPVSDDPLVTGRILYRTIGNPSDALDLFEVAALDNETTTYTDNLADGGLGDPAQWINSTGGLIVVNGQIYGHLGPQSIALGTNAMPKGGYASLAIGSYALGQAEQVRRMVALGDYTFAKNVDGVEGAATGVHCFNENTGSYNTGSGYCSGFWIKGDYNTIHGHFAAAGDTNGGAGIAANLLTVYGAGALRSTRQPTGTSAVFGAFAAENNLDGHNLTIVGNYAARHSTLSYLVVLDNRDRGSEAAEFDQSLLIGLTNPSLPNQFLKVNGILKSKNCDWYHAGPPDETSAGGAINVDGGYIYSTGASADNSNACVFYNGGELVGVIGVSGGTTTSFLSLSDARAKKNIRDAPSASETLAQIKVRQFDWKTNGTHVNHGFIAQELVEFVPEAVRTGDEDTPWGVDPAKLVPLLVKTVQELTARVEHLERSQ